MKTITGLSGNCTELKALSVQSGGASNAQSQIGFSRQLRFTKNGIYIESSAGGKCFIPASEIYALAETHDENIKMPPATVKAKVSIPIKANTPASS